MFAVSIVTAAYLIFSSRKVHTIESKHRDEMWFFNFLNTGIKFYFIEGNASPWGRIAPSATPLAQSTCSHG